MNVMVEIGKIIANYIITTIQSPMDWGIVFYGVWLLRKQNKIKDRVIYGDESILLEESVDEVDEKKEIKHVIKIDIRSLEIELNAINQRMELLPSFGLLGTVLSILTTLKGMSNISNFKEIASSLAPALTTTATGLIMLIANIWFYSKNLLEVQQIIKREKVAKNNKEQTK